MEQIKVTPYVGDVIRMCREDRLNMYSDVRGRLADAMTTLYDLHNLACDEEDFKPFKEDIENLMYLVVGYNKLLSGMAEKIDK